MKNKFYLKHRINAKNKQSRSNATGLYYMQLPGSARPFH